MFGFLNDVVDAVIPDEDFVEELAGNIEDRVEYIASGDIFEDAPGDILGELSPTGLLGEDINDLIGDVLFG